MILKNEHFVNKFELYLFAGFLFLNLIPVFLFKYLPTLDGPAHLHNANLIYNMVLGDSSFLANFYQITKELLPNWSGHFILSSLNSFLPGWLAEKTLVTLYLVFLPLSFRWFIKSISPENYLLSYFIFPFCYSFTFFLGFYNFSLALILLFLLLAFWIKVQKTLKPVNIILLFILFTTLYFSHVFVFLISILATGVIILTQLFDDYEKTSGSQSFQQFLKRITVIIFTSGLGIILSFIFLASRKAFNYSYIPKIELLKWIRDIRPTIVFNFDHETVYTHILFYLIVILTIITLVQMVMQLVKLKSGFTNFIITSVKQNDLWLAFSFLLLLFYFFMPDSNGYSGYFSVRMGLLLFLFFIVWIATRSYNKWVLIISITLIFIANSGLNYYYLKQVRRLNFLAIEINNQAKLIKENTVVLPMNFSTNWIHGHLSNYLGIDKPLVILENYECGTGYFPLKWNDNFPNTTIGNNSKDDFCTDWKTNSLSTMKYPVNFIFILGKQSEINKNKCAQQSIEKISKYYHLISKTENTLLFELME